MKETEWSQINQINQIEWNFVDDLVLNKKKIVKLMAKTINFILKN